MTSYFVVTAPYMKLPRPTYSKGFARLLYGKSFTVNVNVPKGTKNVRAVIMDLG